MLACGYSGANLHVVIGGHAGICFLELWRRKQANPWGSVEASLGPTCQVPCQKVLFGKQKDSTQGATDTILEADTCAHLQHAHAKRHVRLEEGSVVSPNTKNVPRFSAEEHPC